MPDGLVMSCWPAERGPFEEYWASEKRDVEWIRIVNCRAVVRATPEGFVLEGNIKENT
jgi:hypothetical protein